MKKFVFITGAISLSLISLGILFKLLHTPGRDLLFLAGIGLFAIGFIPGITKYLYDKVK